MSKKTNETITNEITSDKPSEAKHNHFSNIVLSGKGKKLSPKTDNHVFFDLAKNDEDCHLYLRLSGNEGGGLHSKKWVPVQSVLTILDEQAKEPFKSTVLKSVFTGSSANNTGFLAGVLRCADIGLITQSGKTVFLHVLATDYEEKKAKLLQLADD